jgi:DNA-binding protein Fis
VLISDAEEIDWHELGLNETEELEQDRAAQRTIISQEAFQQRESEEFAESADKQLNPPIPSIPDDITDPWEALRKGLEHQVSLAVNKSNGSVVPLGRWLTSDLVLAADTAVAGVARQAAALLGMAETTFRRQLEKVKQESAAGLSVRTPVWSALTPIIAHLVAIGQETTDQKLLDQATQLLLQEIVMQVADNDALGSALLGVTKPTYQRRKMTLDA